MSPPELLTSVLGRYTATKAPEDRPLVTLTFAQSLDAKIAGKHGKQLILSGKESMIMTHWMRTMHDAILVGIGTALNDDPQLNTRHLPSPPDGHRHHLPRPIIIDTHLRLSPSCKLLLNYQNGRGRRPWILCTSGKAEEWHRRLGALEKAGATIIQVAAVPEGDKMSINTILSALRQRGIQTLMVEGGARIIASFFTERSAAGEPVVDSVIVTVAPIFVGVGGIGYSVEHESPNFEHVRTDRVGDDAVMAMIARRAKCNDFHICTSFTNTCYHT